MERGVIASPALIDITFDGFMMKRSISPEEIRYYALYWDKIIIPGSNLVYVGIPEEELLIETGVVERPRVSFSGSWGGSDLGHSFALAQSEVAEALLKSNDSCDWVLHQMGNSLALPSKFKTQQRNLRFDLINALPVPSGATPIEDILDFKYRRKDQLGVLHNSLDELYLQVLNSPDPSFSSLRAVDDLKKAISELNQVSNERWKITNKYDFSAQLNLDGGKLVQGVAAGAAFDYFSNPTDLPLGSVIGGLTSMIKLQAKVSSTFEPAKNQSSLGYLSSAHTEKVISAL
ncbi:hypothetical protein VFMJ11_A0742 [Aliivibrio fischeri MJ11]|uniref:Uncharacterized protein n=1 Tax=Aliivibrio fischeri (strain MJ11) TaxID=388396 RepID=B5EUC3_ALIFM|nr:DUF6236 family protein [Aliivibrio fischeri]ACH64482.1 hypothetical protein VFMJ11_A0742 [Aliivibrio fischeri MJ11]